MTNSLLLIATVVIALWLIMIVLYFLIARQQPNLHKQIQSLEKQLDERDGRPATKNSQ